MSRRLLLLPCLAGLLALTLLGLSYGVASYSSVLRRSYAKDGLLTILVIGSDLGPPHRPGDPLRGRADGVHLIAVDSRAKRATIVDFPRDSLVGGRKVNGHLASGSPQRLEGALEAYTGVPIDFWVLGTFRSIENMVDGLGGVDVVVETPMKDAFSGSDFQPGPQRIAGWQALAFVRDRKSVPGGDFGRTRNHGSLLRYAHAQIRRAHGGLPELVRLAGLLARNTATNIPPTELLLLALLATEIPPEHVLQVPLGGTAGMERGAAVVRLAPGGTFDRIRAGQVGP